MEDNGKVKKRHQKKTSEWKCRSLNSLVAYLPKPCMRNPFFSVKNKRQKRRKKWKKNKKRKKKKRNK